jgi:hypothetical protein
MASCHFTEIVLYFGEIVSLTMLSSQEEEDPALGRLLRFALFLVLQLHELRHVRRKSSLDAVMGEGAELMAHGLIGTEERRAHLVVEARKACHAHRYVFYI